MKIIFTKIIAFLSSVMFMIVGISQSTIGYTDGTPIRAEKRNYCFDDDTILIGGYYGGKGLAKYAKEMGYTGRFPQFKINPLVLIDFFKVPCLLCEEDLPLANFISTFVELFSSFLT